MFDCFYSYVAGCMCSYITVLLLVVIVSFLNIHTQA